jgi:hypothetical protein
MSKGSEKVKTWRRRTKERIIKAFGGGCCVCGYNNCVSALALHHLDPSQKDFGLGTIRANSISWNKIVKELRKCVLVCHNHHCEIHEGIITVPADAPRFDESMVDYKKFEQLDGEHLTVKNVSIFNYCSVCLKSKPQNLVACSSACRARIRFNIDWSSINLEEEFKHNTVVSIAKKLGCSDKAVHKKLEKLGLK